MYHISYKTFLALVLSILPFQWLVSIHLQMYCVALVVYNIITHVPLLLGRSLHIRYSITEIGRDISLTNSVTTLQMQWRSHVGLSVRCSIYGGMMYR